MSFSKIFKIATTVAGKLGSNTKGILLNIRRTSSKPKIITYCFLSSAAAVGFSFYIVNLNKISCEVVEGNSETKIERPIERIDSEIKSKQNQKIDYSEAIRKSHDLLQRLKDEVGAPGIVAGVSVNGEIIWEEGLGYSDVENRVPCSKDTVMRIASISKAITMTSVAKLWEQGKLDLDKPIQEYLPYYPSKTFDGKPVVITCRQLVSHLGGIRHYANKPNNNHNASKHTDDKSNAKKKEDKESPEFDYTEYYIKDKYKDVKSSLDLFKDDPLVSKPGSKFHYSTYGWTVVSAIVEAAIKEQFPTHITKLFIDLGMKNTYLDVNDALIYHRSRNYIKDKKGVLINAPYVDNSYKWAGGGFLSTVGDLLQFSNAMLYSFQFSLKDFHDTSKRTEQILSKTSNKVQSKTSTSNNAATISCNVENTQDNRPKVLPGYLNSKTIEKMWSPIADAKRCKYGMGWQILTEECECQFCKKCDFSVFHGGWAVGASSVILILPKNPEKNIHDCDKVQYPKGIVVAILANLQAVNLSKLAINIAQTFDHQSSPPLQ